MEQLGAEKSQASEDTGAQNSPQAETGARKKVLGCEQRQLVADLQDGIALWRHIHLSGEKMFNIVNK